QEIADLKKRVQRLERKKKSRTIGLKRLKKVDMSRRVESSEDQESLGDHEDASKQERRIENIDADVEVTLVNETQERKNEDLMFDTKVLDDDEMFVEATISKKDEQSTKLDDSTASEAVTTASVAPTTIEEITLAHTLIQIKAAKPKVVTTAATTTTTTRPKARGVVVQEPKEEKITRKQEEEANIALIESWDNTQANTQAMMEADFELDQKLREITNEERSRLFSELMNKRKKHFTMLKAEEKRRKLPTKSQKRNQMSTYFKNMCGYNHNQLKSKIYEEIQKMFDNETRRVNTFIPTDSEVVKSKKGTEESSKGTEDELESDKSKKVESSKEKAKGSRKKMLGRKRAEKEQQQESPKRQKLEDDKESDEHEEVEADDTAELKKHLVIKKDDDISIDAIPLATKPPMIVDYKLHKEGVMHKVSTATTYYCLCSVCAAGYKDTTTAELQLLEDLQLSRG
ncbi:hypothetical protein Tco_1443562, partial [Tanacetum coccineum]